MDKSISLDTLGNLNKDILLKLKQNLEYEIDTLEKFKKAIDYVLRDREGKFDTKYIVNKINTIEKEHEKKINNEIQNNNIKKTKKNKLTNSIMKKALDSKNINYAKNSKKDALYQLLVDNKCVKYAHNLSKESKKNKAQTRTYTSDSDE
jgi:hypothetical protein